MVDDRYPRQIRYQFLPEASYVKLAKAYRVDAVSRGKLHSLKDKAKDLPAVEGLFGAPCLLFMNIEHYQHAPERPPLDSGELYDGLDRVALTFDEVKQQLRVCHDELGIEKAHVCSYGINEGGPDVRYPDIFPINEQAGGETKLRELCEYMQQTG